MTEPATTSFFDPSRYLSKVGTADYLEVKWRLVWLRELHPDAELATTLVRDDDQRAVFSARVTIPGGGSATGWGSETYNDFRDYLEKAETKAIGRALAALGFGTQFCGDHEFGAASGRVVDAPIDFTSTRGRRMNEPTGGGNDQRNANTSQAATPRQLKFIQAMARENGMSDDELRAEVEQSFHRPLAELTRRDASALIDRLQGKLPDNRGFSDGAAAPPAKPAPVGPPASPDQLNFIRGLAKDLGLTMMHPDGQLHHDPAQLDAVLIADHGCTMKSMTRQQASEVIEAFKGRLTRENGNGRSHAPAEPPEDEEMVSWTRFWQLARDHKVSGKAAVENLIGPLPTTPDEAKRLLLAAVDAGTPPF